MMFQQICKINFQLNLAPAKNKKINTIRFRQVNILDSNKPEI